MDCTDGCATMAELFKKKNPEAGSNFPPYINEKALKMH